MDKGDGELARCGIQYFVDNERLGGGGRELPAGAKLVSKAHIVSSISYLIHQWLRSGASQFCFIFGHTRVIYTNPSCMAN